MVTNTPPIPALLNAWTAAPAGPVLTWYGPDSERVELTGQVLTNWVTKATNLLQDEGDVAPGSIVGLDLPPHWRTLIWALAVWNCGGEVALPGSPGEVDVQVSAAARPEPAPVTIAIALPALARQVPDLPAGAIDGAAELMAQPDVLLLEPQWDPHSPALGRIEHGELTDSGALATGDYAAGRYLLAPVSAEATLRFCTAVWSGGGSVVLLGDSDADTDRIARQEEAQVLRN